jgi:tetratricopeptide (TPR) repeat protein
VSRFLVPYDENPHFVGREELRKTLREKLVTVAEKQYSHRVALYGLGGVGKTQTALAYVYAHRSDYDAIYWITGVNQASLLSGFQDIAKAGGLQGTHEMEPTDVARVVLEWLRSQDNWLLVIDNLDDFEVAKRYLPAREVSKHTIITTRNPNFIDIPAEGIEISTLDPKDAIELLLLRSFGAKVPAKFDPEKVQTEAAEIVDKLGYLALAIEQAAAFIRETSKDIFRFLPSYTADRKKHHNRLPRGNWEYSNPVSSTWHLSFQKVEEDNEVASELLKLFSFLNPDGILKEFLEAGRDGLPESLGELIGDEDEYYGALNELERFSLIRREDDEDEAMVTMHRLVQAVIKDEMEDEQFSALTEAVLSLCDHAFPHTWEGEARSVCRKYQEQVLATLSEVRSTESDVLLRLLVRVAWFLQEDGKYAQAVELQTKIIEVSTARNGPDHEDTLKAMTRLSTAYRNQKRWDEAIKIQEKVYETNRTKFGDKHLNTWAAMGDLAAAYRSKGRRQEAVEMQEKVLKARQKLLGDDHPDTIRAMGNLAATYRNQRRCADAARYQEEVLKFRRKTLGENNPETMRAMVNLAATYRYQNRADLGAPLEEKVVSYRLKYWGVEHPQTLIALRNLAESYSYLKRWDDACSLQETVLETRKKVFGEEDSETVWAMWNMSDMYRHRGNVEEACKLLERVLEIRRRVLGDGNHETISAMEKLVKSYESLGRNEEALRLKAESMSARKATKVKEF